MREITEDINRTLRGWFEHFKHGISNIYASLDAWIRQRLRAILRFIRGRGRPPHLTRQEETFRDALN